MNVTLVPVGNVDAVWPLISERMDACLNGHHGDCSAGDLWTMCRIGNAFLIVAHDGTGIKSASIWRFENWTSETVFRCLIAVGEDMAEWFEDAREIVTSMTRQGGAQSFVWDGRKGWQRKVPDAEIVKFTYQMKV